MELELAIERGESQRAQDVLSEIRQHHVQEPGVAEATYRILYAAGLVAPSGQPSPAAQAALSPQASGAPAEDAGPGIWTPGSDDAIAEPGKKSALWTP